MTKLGLLWGSPFCSVPLSCLYQHIWYSVILNILLVKYSRSYFTHEYRENLPTANYNYGSPAHFTNNRVMSTNLLLSAAYFTNFSHLRTCSLTQQSSHVR